MVSKIVAKFEAHCALNKIIVLIYDLIKAKMKKIVVFA